MAAVSLFVRQQLAPSVKVPNRADLVVLKELIDAGKVTPVIDEVYPLSRTPEAIGQVATEHACTECLSHTGIQLPFDQP